MLNSKQAMQKLMDGNKRFVNFEMQPKSFDTDLRKDLINRQTPYAVVITCSDSRVCPEIIFDCGLGEIFVIRVAAGALNPDLLGSIEYAVLALNVQLIVMLGHDNCGVMECILRDKADLSEDIKKLCDHVSRNFNEEDKKTLTASEGVKIATLHDVALLREIPALKNKMSKNELEIVPAHYNFYNNEVEILTKNDKFYKRILSEKIDTVFSN